MKMSNGSTINATIFGIVMLSDHITLYNIYFILIFTVNLIFVTLLSTASDFFLNYYTDKCLFFLDFPRK